jgi:hypothetical protein
MARRRQHLAIDPAGLARLQLLAEPQRARERRVARRGLRGTRRAVSRHRGDA